MGVFQPGPDHPGRISEQVQSAVTFSVESPESLRAHHRTTDGHTISLSETITANQSIVGFKLSSKDIVGTATSQNSFSATADVILQFADGTITGIDQFPVTVSAVNAQSIDLSDPEYSVGNQGKQYAQVA